MQYISILQGPTKEAIRAFAEKRNFLKYLSETYEHPQEDYLIVSADPPVFVVADGVTLNFKKIVEDKKEYPNPSPAGKVAKIFCEAVQKQAKNAFEHFSESGIKTVFKEANKAVADYNNRIGRSEVSGNPTGFYSATGSFVVIKDAKAYWASICDAFVAHFDKDMNKKFMSSGSCSPYAVINGEGRMVEHIEHGVFDLKIGDRVFVFTDGFKSYMENAKFLNLFKNWPGDLTEQVSRFSKEANLNDPESYGHERSIIGVAV